MTHAAPHSLRKRLLYLLFGAVVLTAAIQAFIAYRAALAETNEVFDYQMEQMALSFRPGLPEGAYPNNAFRDDADPSFEFIVQVSTTAGRLLFQSTPDIHLPTDAAQGLTLFEHRGITYKLYSLRAGSQFIQVAQDRAARRDLARKLAIKTVSPVFVMVPVLLFLVWWVVSASLVPVDRVRRQVAARRAEELSELSEEGLPDEIHPLVHELNLLFQRVRDAFDAQKNFIADAAHELRSPLAALKLQAEGLRRAADAPGREVAIQRLTAGIDRATRMVEQLLMLARQQAQPSGQERKTAVALADLVQGIVTDAWERANARHIDIGVVAADTVHVSGYPEALGILVHNLLDNAIKYTPQGGTINVAVRTCEAGVQLVVEDSGPGIPAQEQVRIFDRFYRGSAQHDNRSGSGLGLSIVKTIAQVHAASIALAPSPQLGGLQITVQFPVAGRDIGQAML